MTTFHRAALCHRCWVEEQHDGPIYKKRTQTSWISVLIEKFEVVNEVASFHSSTVTPLFDH